LFAETDETLHKQRRKALNPFFSRAGVQKLEPIIDEKIALFKAKLERLMPKGPINVSMGMRCITVDVISQFAFGKSNDLMHENKDTFEAELLHAVDETGKALVELYLNNALRWIASSIPLSLTIKVQTSLAPIHKLQVVR